MSEVKKIKFFDPHFGYEEILPQIEASVLSVVKSGQFIHGPVVEAFEAEVSDFLDAPFAVSMNSATDALIIGLRALGIGPGDEVITSPLTFFATAEAIRHLGARVVFSDIDSATFNLDPKEIESRITSSTRAIVVVHLYGRASPMEEILMLAKAHGLHVIEDCAQAFGGFYKDARLGTLGDLGVYSFFPTKNLGAWGDGGLLVGRDLQLGDEARLLRAHGAKTRYYHEKVGYNSRLDAIQAAVLRAKLPYLDSMNQSRREMAQAYRERLSQLQGLVLPEIPKSSGNSHEHVFHQYTIRIQKKSRDEVQQALAQEGIETQIYYPHLLHLLPPFREFKSSLPSAEKVAGEILSLPLRPDFKKTESKEIVDRVSDALFYALR